MGEAPDMNVDRAEEMRDVEENSVGNGADGDATLIDSVAAAPASGEEEEAGEPLEEIVTEEGKAGEGKVAATSEDEEEEEDIDEVEDPFDDSLLPPVSVVDMPETGDEQRTIIEALDRDEVLKTFREGEPWFLVSGRWWKSWCDYARFGLSAGSFVRSTGPPGPIENDFLVEPAVDGLPYRVKKSMMERYDYYFLNRGVWENLYRWYGGGPPLLRRVIVSGYYSTTKQIEVRPLLVRFFKSSDRTKELSVICSKVDSVGRTKRRMCKALGLKTKDVQLWDYHGGRKYKHMEKEDLTLEGCQILDGQALLLQEREEDGNFPKEAAGSSPGYGYTSYQQDNITHGAGTDPGTVGLVNLGNTCFMNSALQCLAHTPPLERYFVSKQYKHDINKVNVLGLKGQLATAFGDLLALLWSREHSSCSPRLFKQKMEQFAPQFQGYQQHDSQELLGYLMDGLHEDLNLVQQKPYRELPDADGRLVDDVADDEWNYHWARNNSVINDMFLGQLRSELTCPDCDRVAYKFDPFMSLTLPLPTKQTRRILCRLVPKNGANCSTEYGVDVKKHATFRAFTEKLSELSGIPAAAIKCASTEGGRLYDKYTDKDTLENIRDLDIVYAYEVEENPHPSKATELNGDDAAAVDLPPWRHFYVYQRKDEPSRSWYNSTTSYPKTFGLPVMISLRRGQQYTYPDLVKVVYDRLSRFFSTDLEGIFSWDITTDASGRNDMATSTTSFDSALSSSTELSVTPIDNDLDLSASDNILRTNSSDEDVDEHASDDALSDDDRVAAKPPPPDRSTKPRLPPFQLFATDSTGLRVLQELKDDGEPISISEDIDTIVLHWVPQGQDGPNKIFVTSQVNAHNKHASVNAEEEEVESRLTLERSLDMFTEEEQLGEDDMWYCSKCKDFRQATKKMDVWRLPPYLVVHLKRFSGSGTRWSGREKLDTMVEYPVHNLDLSKHSRARPGDPAPIYDLYAVSCHFGGMGGGHYTAYARNHHTGSWYNFDDSHVRKVDENRVVDRAGYVLLYRRQDTYKTDDLPLDSTEIGISRIFLMEGEGEDDDSTKQGGEDRASNDSGADDTDAADDDIDPMID